jgi:HD-GYP domain-containing protein (c-di-GMP phosphodiesterase class II)
MQKIPIDRLQEGVFISLAGVGWLRHPFMLNEFCISSEKQIRALQEMGLKEIGWDPVRSNAQPLPEKKTPAVSHEEDFGHAALAGMLDEKRSRIERVRERREQFARQERAYEKDTAVAADVLKNLAGHPAEGYGQAKTLVGRVVTNLIAAESEVIQLVNSKVKDAGPASHAINVMVLALMLGKALDLSEEEMKCLGMGALLHDAGKSEIPLRILRSAARTPPEEQFYRAHVGYGIMVVAGIRDLPVPVKNIIACHHEHWDGSGYPNALTAAKIPKLARLVAIANRYDNLCNPFDIKLAKTPAETVTQLFKSEAAHFQTEILQAFVKTLGVYPPGSFVELSNGAVGLVIESDSADILHPMLMLYDEEIPRAEAILLDLRGTGLSVVSAVNPATLPLAVVEYLAPRRRIDYYVEGMPA